MANAFNIFRPDAVDIPVQRSRVGQGRPRGEELEKVGGGEDVCQALRVVVLFEVGKGVVK